MGGFGSGGRRPGSGKKPKSKHERKVQGSRHRTRARDVGVPDQVPEASTTAELVTPPQDLDPMVRDVWGKLASHAIGAGTLTPATAYAFQRVCELEARRRRMEAQIDLDGLMVTVMETDEESGARFSLGEPRVHPLITHERQLQQRVEAGFARFAITGNGKSLLGDSDKTDPFKEFDGPVMKVVRGGKA